MDRIEAHFWDKVNKIPNGCWEWTGALNNIDGYGIFWNGTRNQTAHRFAYEGLVGSVPDGLEIDHLCRNKKCVNPAHLETVTRSGNTSRGMGPTLAANYQRSKTHCPQGHPYDEQNTYVYPNGRRCCRTCGRESMGKWREKCKAV